MARKRDSAPQARMLNEKVPHFMQKNGDSERKPIVQAKSQLCVGSPEVERLAAQTLPSPASTAV